MSMILVSGLVSNRDYTPRIELNDAQSTFRCQMDAEDAIKLALDIIKMAEATMADALLIRWCSKNMKEQGAKFGAALMMEFRDFRAELEDDSGARQRGDKP